MISSIWVLLWYLKMDTQNNFVKSGLQPETESVKQKASQCAIWKANLLLDYLKERFRRAGLTLWTAAYRV